MASTLGPNPNRSNSRSARYRHQGAARIGPVASIPASGAATCLDGAQHIRDGVMERAAGEDRRPRWRIPVHPALQAILDATPGEHLTFLVTRAATL